MGFWAMTLSGGAPIGNLIFGPAADKWGVTAILMVQAAFVVVALVLLAIRVATDRRAGRQSAAAV